MTETDERPPEGRPQQAHEGPRVSGQEMRDLGRLRRSRTDRYLGGVAAGIARHFDIDPTVVRVLFVVTSFFGGAGVLAYAAFWLVVPEEGDDHSVLHLRGDVRRNAIIVVAAIAVLVLLGNAWGGGWGFWHFSWLLVVVGLAALLLANRDHRRHDAATSTAPAPPAGPPPQPPYDDVTATEATQPLPWQPPAPAPAPRPRRTGIIWFWPTLALIAIGLGTLAVIGAGQGLPAGSYPALALAIIGAVLLLGAFVGRAGGLIALGLLASIALVISTAAGQIGLDTQARDLHRTPTTAAAVQPRYHVGTGRILLDLGQVADPAALDGRRIAVSNNVGDIEVTVPRDVDVVVDADISYVGGIHVDGESRTGDSPTLHTVIDGGTGVPQLRLDLHERVGQIKVVQEGAFQ